MAEGTGFAGYGYTDSGGEKISALIDMINGGGAGRAGQQFEGGGILSLIANALFSPYGSRARGADSPATAMRPPARPADLAPAPAPASAPPSPARQAAPVPTDARGPRTLAEIMAAAGRTQLPTGGPGTFAPGALPAEVLMQSTPPRDPDLVASELVPPFRGGLPEMAPTPSVPNTQAPAVGGFAAPQLRPRARPMAFEGFVASLGPAAESAGPEVLREAYRLFLERYTPN